MQSRDRVCPQCQIVTPQTRSPAPLCMSCTSLNKRMVQVEKDRVKLEAISEYRDITGPVLGANNKFIWGFTHTVCGTTQEWSMNNLNTRMVSAPGIIPCKKCGVARRFQKSQTQKDVDKSEG